MDLVVGATGLVGQQVALGLRRQGRAVRALVRGGTRHERAAPLISAGIEVVDADLTRPESLPSVCSAVETVICTATSMPGTLGREALCLHVVFQQPPQGLPARNRQARL